MTRYLWFFFSFGAKQNALRQILFCDMIFQSFFTKKILLNSFHFLQFEVRSISECFYVCWSIDNTGQHVHEHSYSFLFLWILAHLAHYTQSFFSDFKCNEWMSWYMFQQANTRKHVSEHSWSSAWVILNCLAHLAHLAQSYFSLIFSAINIYDCSDLI